MPLFPSRVPVTRPFLPDISAIAAELEEVWARGWLTNNGPQLHAYRDDLCALFETPHVDLLANGAVTLEAILECMELEGEVIVPAFTFPATAHAVLRAGLKPVFADIEPTRLTVDPEAVEALCTDRTCAILAVHMFGMPCYVDELQEIADRRGIALVYDAAHMLGIRYQGRPISAYGDAAMFSLHATKIVHAVEGGALVYRDAALRPKLASFVNHGIGGASRRGTNAKMSELHALVGRIVLAELPRISVRLEKLRAFYDDALSDLAGVQRVYHVCDGLEGPSGFYPVLFDKDVRPRDEIMVALAADNIDTRAYFDPPLNEDPRFGADPVGTPVAKDISGRIMALPFFADLDHEDAGKIVMALKRAIET